MLILSRKTGEEIILGDDIVIRVTEIGKGNVKLGIEAPAETIILRGELRNKIETVNKKASAVQNAQALKALRMKLDK